MPTVSVIIPTYNYGRFIDEALKSVFDQTFQDFEVIVVDDGSTDDTQARIEAYGDRIKYFRQQQKGPAAARNLGIKESVGEFIAFLDADDLWYPTKLEKQIKLMRTNPNMGLALTDNALFDDDGIYKDYVGKKSRFFEGDLVSNIFLKSGVVTPTVMIRREVLRKVGVFDESLYLAEDDNLWVRIAVEYDAGIVDESLAQIRDHRFRTMRISGKLNESIEKSIQLLTTKYGPRVAAKTKPLASEKYYQIYYNTGYQFFTDRDNKNARKQFLKAIYNKPSKLNAYIYLLATFFPLWAASVLRRLKNILLPDASNTNKWTRDQNEK